MKSIRRMNYKELDAFMKKNRLLEVTFRDESKIRRELDGKLLLYTETCEGISYGYLTEFIR